MSMLPVPAPLNEADYAAIEEAVMETARGRWFLAEYARRNRQADTTVLLTALDRIEGAIRGAKPAGDTDRVRMDLVDMAKAISRTKAEIAAIKPDQGHDGKFGEATEELDAVVQSTETATSEILAAAEQIQEIAWTLREQGLDGEICDILDAKATDVYTACSFQDLTGQRTRKVIQVLRYLESRINAMIDIWGLDGAMAAEAAEGARARKDEATLLNGPALPGQGLDQADVDMVMGPAAEAHQPVPARRMETIERKAPGREPATPKPHANAHLTIEHAAIEHAPIEHAPIEHAAAPPLAPANGAAAPRQPMAPSDRLAAVAALSYEEKIALFT